MYIFPPDFWVFVFFGDIWVLRDPPFSAGKKKKKIVKGSAGAYVEHVCKISGSNSQKRRGHLDFHAVECKKSRPGIVITWLLVLFDFGR